MPDLDQMRLSQTIPWRPFHLVGWVLSFLLFTSIGALIPPIQSPDEHSHLGRAYLISRGDLGLTTLTDGKVGGEVDTNLVQFWTPYLYTVAIHANERLAPAQLQQLEQLRWSSSSQFIELAGAGYYAPLVYAPQAAGLFLGRAMGLTIANSYRLTRWFTLLVCWVLLAAALRMHSPSPFAIALMLLPMSVFQLLAPTLDGLTNCLSVLVLSTFMWALRAERTSSSIHWWIMGIGLVVLTTSRTHLLPLLSLPIYLAWHRRVWPGFVAATLTCLVALGWTFHALHHTIDSRVSRAVATKDLLVHYLQTPSDFFRVVNASLSDASQFQFYEQSFIGILGWLDTRLPDFAYPTLWTGLSICALVSITRISVGRDALVRVLLLLLAMASAMLIFMALLVTWTPHPATTIQGVQGRYFLIPAIMLAFGLAGAGSSDTREGHGLSALVVVTYSVISIGILIATLLSRYH